MSKIDRSPKIEELDPKRAVGFAASPVLPGESQEDFDGLRDDLYEQYQPEGPAEEDAVQTMANAIWRKRHLKIFQRAFEARMRWGSYFKYPGDHDGSKRMFQEDYQLMAVTSVQGTTAIATTMVEKKLAKAGADSTEKVNDNAEIAGVKADVTRRGAENELAESKTDGRKETNNNTTSDDLPEGILKRIVENALAEIKVDGAETDTAISAEVVAEIVKGVAEREFAAEKAKSKDQERCSMRERAAKVSEAFAKVPAAFEKVFGRAVTEEILEQTWCLTIEKSLAEFGDLLTPECHTAELRLIELIDLTIERSHDRLMKFQASRAKKAAVNVNSLQPGWAARKR